MVDARLWDGEKMREEGSRFLDGVKHL